MAKRYSAPFDKTIASRPWMVLVHRQPPNSLWHRLFYEHQSDVDRITIVSSEHIQPRRSDAHVISGASLEARVVAGIRGRAAEGDSRRPDRCHPLSG